MRDVFVSLVTPETAASEVKQNFGVGYPRVVPPSAVSKLKFFLVIAMMITFSFTVIVIDYGQFISSYFCPSFLAFYDNIIM